MEIRLSQRHALQKRVSHRIMLRITLPSPSKLGGFMADTEKYVKNLRSISVLLCSSSFCPQNAFILNDPSLFRFGSGFDETGTDRKLRVRAFDRYLFRQKWIQIEEVMGRSRREDDEFWSFPPYLTVSHSQLKQGGFQKELFRTPASYTNRPVDRAARNATYAKRSHHFSDSSLNKRLRKTPACLRGT